MDEAMGRQHRAILQGIAGRAMLVRGLAPDFSPQALAELGAIHGPAMEREASTRDLRGLLWCSIDSDKGTWVRVLNPPIEGRLKLGFEGLDIGHKLRVTLIHTNVERGFIDFSRCSS